MKKTNKANKGRSAWVVGGFAALVVVLLGIVAGVDLTSVGGSFWPRAEETGSNQGYPLTVASSELGVPPQSVGVGKLVSAAEGDVQNIQPPTISGFSSDLFTGSATVSYPLSLPPGRGGLTPSISFNYSSANVYGPVMGADVNGDTEHEEFDITGGGGKDSWYDQLITQSSQVGLGWNVSGLGYVFRDRVNRYTLVLNGQSYRLFKDPTEGEWDGLNWHTDPESFLKIEHSTTEDEPMPPAFNPNNFEIVDANGTNYTFEPLGYVWKKNCPNECHWVHFYNQWFLTKVHDVHGNEILVDYDVEQQRLTFVPVAEEIKHYPRAIYPRQIRYTGSVTEGGFKTKVEFEFADRDDKRIANGPCYWEGTKPVCPLEASNQFSFSDKRITRVDIKVKRAEGGIEAWETVRQYELLHDDPDDGDDLPDYFMSARDTGDTGCGGLCPLHLRLWGIKALGRNGETLPAYTFDYHDDHGDYETYRLLKQADNGYGGAVEYFYETYVIDDYGPKTGERWSTVSGGHRVTKKKVKEEAVTGGVANFFVTTYDYGSGPTVGISDWPDHSGFESLGHIWVVGKVYKKNTEDQGAVGAVESAFRRLARRVTGVLRGGSVAGNGDPNVLTTTVYHFDQGEYFETGNCVGKFFVWPERGRLVWSKVYNGDLAEWGREGPDDLTPEQRAKLFSFAESDYLREKKDGMSDRMTTCEEYVNRQDTVWNTAHFIAAKETRSCQEHSEWPKGSLITYQYHKTSQGGKQWGNLTHALEYEVSGCNFDNATPYRMTHNVYLPNSTTGYITNRSNGTETFACNSGLAGTVDNYSSFVEGVDCPTPKRTSLVWNLYDGNRGLPRRPDKGLLTASRVWYDFPETVNPTWLGEFNAATCEKGEVDPGDGKCKWRTVDIENKYDGYESGHTGKYGNLTATSSFKKYGWVSTTGGWNFSSLGDGSEARESKVIYENTEDDPGDFEYYTFPLKMINSLGHKTETRYYSNEENEEVEVFHPSLAQKTVVIDANRKEWTTEVDGFGRTTATYLPGEEAIAQTIVEYNDIGQKVVNPFRVYTRTRDDEGDDDPATPISYSHSWQFYNGLGQVIETQAEKEGDGAKIALTAASYNTLGQAEKTLLPYEVGQSGPDYGRYLEPEWNRLERTEVDYDSLGRVIESRTPTKAGGWYKTKTGYYGRKTAVFDSKNHLAVSEVDNLGRALETQIFNRQLFTDTNSLPEDGLQLPTDYYVKTRLDYDSLDRVTRTTTADLASTPAKTAVSEVFYNQFGQKMASIDPDLGTWRYTYDPVGTLAAMTDAGGNVKSFVYDALNRLISKHYGGKETAAVASFSYDVPSFGFGVCANGVGRLCSDSTANRPADGFIGARTGYTYDAKGRLEKETKMMDLEGTGAWSLFTTEFAYDAAGRQREVTYPDLAREKVVYSYNEAGLLNEVAGMINGIQQTYLDDATYNLLGQRKEEILGNGTVNAYTYEPRTNRLASITTRDRGGVDIWKQELKEYDPVGNITKVVYPLYLESPFSPAHPFEIDYQYDDLNRLTGNSLARFTPEAADLHFSTDYDYDHLGRMTFKKEMGELGSLGNETVVQNVSTDSVLVVEVPSREYAFITFDLYDKRGKGLTFIGDKAEKDSVYPYTVFLSLDVLARYNEMVPADYEGYITVESHKQIHYPGSADGPDIRVRHGSVEEFCTEYPDVFSCPAPNPSP